MHRYRYSRLETPCGAVWLHASSADHIYLSAAKSLNVGEESEDGRHGPLVINGVEYGVSGHLYRHPGDVFLFGEHKLTMGAPNWWSALSIQKTDLLAKDRSPSDKARLKCKEVLEAAVNEWVKANGRILVKAAYADLAERIERAEGEVATARKALEDAEARLNALKGVAC